MKLKELNEKQVVQTTEENHKAFMKLLNKEGFKWRTGSSYLRYWRFNKYSPDSFYLVKLGMFSNMANCIIKGYEIIPASKFLKPSRKELLKRIERIENHVFVPIIMQPKGLTPKETKQLIEALKAGKPNFIDPSKPTITEPKKGDLCAFADEESDFDNNQFRVGELANIKPGADYKYRNSRKVNYKYARKVEIKFI